jgi:hypothetical protein
LNAAEGERAKPRADKVTFQAAAREATEPEKPEPARTPHKRRKAGGEGDQYRARKIVADYLGLCHDPTKDLPRWLREDKRYAGGPHSLSLPIMTGEGKSDAAKTTATPFVAHADRLRGQPLQKLCGGLDENWEGRGRVDNLLARPRAGPSRYDELRPLRGQAGGIETRGSEERGTSLKGLSAALRAFYGAKIEAVRQSVPTSERAAAMRALCDDRAVALRVLAQMRAASAAAIKRRQIVRRSARTAERRDKDVLEMNAKIICNML